jgi:uncharacterized protein (UPF0261 family)
LGGSAGSTIGSAAMRTLPIGVPKLLVSTLASGQVRHYVGDKDILMLNAVVDISGINRISRAILGNAAAAWPMVLQRRQRERPATWNEARPAQRRTNRSSPPPCLGHHALRRGRRFSPPPVTKSVFHYWSAVGDGNLIRDGLIAGVLDITTTEIADELVGGPPAPTDLRRG